MLVNRSLTIIADISYILEGGVLSSAASRGEDVMPRLTEYLTLPEAAARYGYRSDSTLRTAARTGKLRTKRLGPRAIVTTEAWVVNSRP